MNYKAMIKKQSTIIAIAVICLTVATIGISYALFFQVETNTNNQLVEAGTLNVEYGSGSSAITATELIPMSDEEALSSTTMTGTIYIENTGTLAANYEVKLGDDTETFDARTDKTDTDELLSHEYIRVAAYLDGSLIVAPTKLSDIEYSLEDEAMHSLFRDTINSTGTGDNSATIVLKVWIAEDAPESIIGDFVYLKMDVTSEVDELVADGKTYDLKNKILTHAKENNYLKTETPDFGVVTTTDEYGLYRAADDYGISYYFRGDVDNNYVEFGTYAEDTPLNVYDYSSSAEKTVEVKAGDPMYWRIVRINGDGSVRLVYDGTEKIANGTAHTATIGATAYNTNYDNAKYVGYTYDDGTGTQVDSTIKGVVDAWYNTHLEETYGTYIEDSIFCNDRSVSSTTDSGYIYYGGFNRLENNKKPSLKCINQGDRYTMDDITNGNGYLSNPVGLLTADEIAMAGGANRLNNTSYYLYSQEFYWTSLPYAFEFDIAYAWYVDADGYLSGNAVNDSSSSVRPVINLKADIEFTGDGTIDNPYQIKELAE